MSHTVKTKVISFKNAEKFLDSLSQVSGYLAKNDSKPIDWIYRGVGSNKHRLIPSALRNNARLMSGANTWITGVAETNRHQLRNEIITLDIFFRYVMEKGLFLSDDPARIQKVFGDWRNTLIDLSRVSIMHDDHQWPDERLLSLIAVAQHHGLHTRVLDFTTNPYIACYFAAKHLLEESDSSYMSVWAISRYICFEDNEVSQKPAVLRLIRTSGYGNENISLQRGLFVTIINKEIDLNAKPIITPIDELLENRPIIDQTNGYMPSVYRFDLSRDQVFHVLSILDRMNLNGISLFAGYAGIVQGLFERKYYDSLQN